MIRFGTDGVRGTAGEHPIDGAGAVAVGAAAARWARELGRGRVLVGRDTRPSGASLAASVTEGVVNAGGVALDARVVPTPALQAALAAGVGEVGVVVTASHNPADDNGFKVLGPGGHKPDDDEVQRLERWMAEGCRAPGGAVGDGEAAVRAAYLDAVSAALREGGVPEGLRGRRIAVDLAAGAATATFTQLVTLLPEVDWVVRGQDGRINDGCGSEHPGALSALMRGGGCAAGIAVDGDADRCVLVDERGEVVAGDALLGLLTRSFGVDELITTVMSSTALEARLTGVRVVRTAVGDRHVAAAMRARGARLGGEESGHVLLHPRIPGGDGLVVGLTALAAAWRAAPTISEAMAPFAPFPRRLTKVQARQRVAVDAIPGVAAVVAAHADPLGPGRVFIRWSGTEPVLRVLVEGPSAAAVQAASAEVTAACRAGLGVG
jgi:phosphoglucosamine mutase